MQRQEETIRSTYVVRRPALQEEMRASGGGRAKASGTLYGASLESYVGRTRDPRLGRKTRGALRLRRCLIGRIHRINFASVEQQLTLRRDGNIRYFEYENDSLHFLNEYKSSEPRAF